MISISVLAGLFAMVGWGIGDFIQSKLVRDLGEYKTMFAFQVFSLIGLLPFLFIKGIFDINLSNFIIILLGGIVNIFSFFNFLKSLKVGDVSVVVPISATYPFLTILLLWLVLGQVVSLQFLIGAIIILAGLALTSIKIKELK